MSQPATIPLQTVIDWFTEQSLSERAEGEIAKQTHIKALREKFKRDMAKKHPNQPPARANTAQDAMENAA